MVLVSGQPTLALAGLYTAGSGGLLWYNDKLVTKKEEEVSSLHGLETAFRRLYARQLAEGDEFVNSLWKRTVGPLKLAVTTQGLAKVEKVSHICIRKEKACYGVLSLSRVCLHLASGVELRAEGDAAHTR